MTLQMNNFSNNSAIETTGSVIYALESTIVASVSLLFINNTGKRAGCITLTLRSTLQLEEGVNISFIANKGHNGGAIAFYDHSVMKFSSIHLWELIPSTVIFERNAAQAYGGAIYVDDSTFQIEFINQNLLQCFLKGSRFKKNVVIFDNNTAQYGGDNLFGGWIDICLDSLPFRYGLFKMDVYSYNVRNFLFQQKINSSQHSLMSSNPSRVCVCEDSIPRCDITNYNITAFAGQTLVLSVAAVGQRFGTVRTVIKTSSLQEQGHSIISDVGKFCTDLKITVISHRQHETISLTVADTSTIPKFVTSLPLKYSKLFEQLYIDVTLSPCPPGFTFNKAIDSCSCDSSIKNCNIDTNRITREKNMWINATLIHSTPLSKLVVHNSCPFHYCLKMVIEDFDLTHPDTQCNFRRSGILCGKCQMGLSLVLGTSNCKKCSNLSILTVVSISAIVGFVLVTVLIQLNLTISIGTCLLYTSPSPRDATLSRMPSSA